MATRDAQGRFIGGGGAGGGSADVDVSAFNAALASLGGGVVEVLIGFNVDYAAAVHEVLTAHHDQGQAKYLEAAMRSGVGRRLVETAIQAELRAVTHPSQVRDAVKRGVLKAAMQILGDAQELAPVATGALKGSGTWQGPEIG